MTTELPSVTIEGVTLRPYVIPDVTLTAPIGSEEPLPMEEEHLIALLAALPRDVRSEVMGKALAAIARGLESALTAERERREGVERELEHAQFLLAIVSGVANLAWEHMSEHETRLVPGRLVEALKNWHEQCPRGYLPGALRAKRSPIDASPVGNTCGGKRELHGFGVPGHDCADCSAPGGTK